MLATIVVVFVIVMIFAFFLNMKIKAEISCLEGQFVFKVKYLWFTIFPFKKKVKKENKKEEIDCTSSPQDNNIDDESVQENTENTVEVNSKTASKKEKIPLADKVNKLLNIFEKVKIIWSVSKKHLLHIFKYIYIEDLMIDFMIADEDAYKAAMNYGKTNAVVYNFINFIRTFFTITIKTVDIACDFESKESVYDFSAKITVKPSTILSAVFGILFGLLINLRKLIGKNNKKQSSGSEAVST